MRNNAHRLAHIVGQAWNHWKSVSRDLLQIETKKVSLKAAQTVRLTVLGIFSLAILCGVTMMTIAMIHVAIFLSFPEGKKLWAALLLTALDLSAMIVLARRFFSEKEWIKYAQYYRWLYCGQKEEEPPLC